MGTTGKRPRTKPHKRSTKKNGQQVGLWHTLLVVSGRSVCIPALTGQSARQLSSTRRFVSRPFEAFTVLGRTSNKPSNDSDHFKRAPRTIATQSTSWFTAARMFQVNSDAIAQFRLFVLRLPRRRPCNARLRPSPCAWVFSAGRAPLSVARPPCLLQRGPLLRGGSSRFALFPFAGHWHTRRRKKWGGTADREEECHGSLHGISHGVRVRPFPGVERWPLPPTLRWKPRKDIGRTPSRQTRALLLGLGSGQEHKVQVSISLSRCDGQSSRLASLRPGRALPGRDVAAPCIRPSATEIGKQLVTTVDISSPNAASHSSEKNGRERDRRPPSARRKRCRGRNAAVRGARSSRADLGRHRDAGPPPLFPSLLSATTTAAPPGEKKGATARDVDRAPSAEPRGRIGEDDAAGREDDRDTSEDGGDSRGTALRRMEACRRRGVSLSCDGLGCQLLGATLELELVGPVAMARGVSKLHCKKLQLESNLLNWGP